MPRSEQKAAKLLHIKVASAISDLFPPRVPSDNALDLISGAERKQSRRHQVNLRLKFSRRGTLTP